MENTLTHSNNQISSNRFRFELCHGFAKFSVPEREKKCPCAKTHLMLIVADVTKIRCFDFYFHTIYLRAMRSTFICDLCRDVRDVVLVSCVRQRLLALCDTRYWDHINNKSYAKSYETIHTYTYCIHNSFSYAIFGIEFKCLYASDPVMVNQSGQNEQKNSPERGVRMI